MGEDQQSPGGTKGHLGQDGFPRGHLDPGRTPVGTFPVAFLMEVWMVLETIFVVLSVS